MWSSRRAALVVGVLLALTGPVVPPSPVGTPPAPSTIDGCTTISDSGAYRLTEDVTNSTESACIRIRADDVVLDGGGHVIDGSPTELDWRQKLLGGTDYNSGIGVVVTGAGRLTNVTVRNLTVTEWEAGLAFENVSRASVRHVEATGSDTGIRFQNVSDSTVSRATVARNVEDGLGLYRANDVAIHAVEARRNHFAGIAVFASTGVSVADASVVGNHGDGVVLANGTRHRLVNVTAADNTVGLFLLSTDESTVRHSESRGNSFAGILLARATNNTLTENRVVNTTGTTRLFDAPSGIVLFEASHNRIEDLIARNNRPWTIFARNGSADNRISNLSLSTGIVSVHGRDVALRSASLPPSAPLGVGADAPRVNVTGTSPDAQIELRFRYAEGVAGDERAIFIWQFEDGAWTATEATIDPTAKTASVSLENLGVGSVTSVALGVGNETSTPGRETERILSRVRERGPPFASGSLGAPAHRKPHTAI